MIHKLKTAWSMALTYKNWPRVILYKIGVMPAPMVVEVRNGPKFFIRGRHEQDADLYVANESFLYGIHNEMLPYMKNAKVGLDVGAHIGTFTMFAGAYSPAKIYAVEPEQDNFELLKKNIALNGWENRITPVQAVISSGTGDREFFVSENRGFNSLVESHGADYGGIPIKEKINVKSFSFGDFFKQNGIEFCDFMKVDIEGAEYEVFSNLPYEVYQKIGVIGLEVGGRPDEERAALEDHIRSMGFTVLRPNTEFSERFCVNNKVLKGRV